MCNDFDLNRLYKEVSESKKYALGYPVNREPVFKINLEKIGLLNNTFATTFMNNVGSSYSTKAYCIDDIKELEVKVIDMIFQHLSGVGEPFGYITSGGTEGNFASVWWHREFLAKTFNETPILIASDKSHYSLDKIANQLQIKLTKLNAENLLDDLVETLKNNTLPIIFWANIGSTIDGTIDDVVAIKKILANRDDKYKIHADGAIYGFVVPYIINNIFNCIDTIAISGHKFLGSYNVCGIVICHKPYIEAVFAYENKQISYVRNTLDYTVSGSRGGMHIIELYLLLERALIKNDVGKTNLELLWQQCLKNANWFYNKLKDMLNDNQLLWYKPNQLSILVPSPRDNLQKLALSKKYALMPVNDNQLGIYIFPRSTIAKLEQFLIDYQQYNNLFNK